ncbi:MAG: hypothetical protein IT537_20290 [Hyphomicrobiales bacterium]|nr:hypothetical protein [Hyphomicrobiales bacterium]
MPLPSLLAYLVLSQDEVKAWVWTRQAGLFSPGPTVLTGLDQTVPIAALGLVLPLNALYAGIAIA